MNAPDYVPELDSVCVLDLETSGTNQNSDQVLEIAALFGTVDHEGFHEVARLTHVLPLITDPLTWDPFVQNMHTANGLLSECHSLGEAPGRFDLVDDELCFLSHPDKFTLMGNTVHFDLGFVRRVFPKFGKTLSHRVLDVSGARLFCQSLGMPYPGKGPQAHRALEDCLNSIQMYRVYQEWVRISGGEGQL